MLQRPNNLSQTYLQDLKRNTQTSVLPLFLCRGRSTSHSSICSVSPWPCCYKSTPSTQGEVRALHCTPGMGSPNRVLCPKPLHLRVAQPQPHTVAAAPSHDWTQAKETQCSGLAPSSLPLCNPTGCTQVTQLDFHPDHSWTVSRALLVNTQAGNAPVHLVAIARMAHVGFGLAQSGLKACT